MLSRRCAYGLRAALFLAGRPEGVYVPIHTIGARLGISPYFLAKILQQLTQAGLLQSFRGPHGGVALARPAGAISLEEIVAAIDGRGVFEACVIGLPGCGERRPCPLHDQWGAVRARIHALFAGMTLAEAEHRLRAEGLRITDVPPSGPG
ncbi:Rrf2 family transcriptional regulator [Rhodocaloribacter litoris]|nr:Rrf2 family transcriptional regulator [Rhodocaloribacter litoris]